MSRYHRNKTFKHFGVEVKLENTQMLTFTMILAHKIVCSDGAINEIKTYFENKTISRGPDFIIGDFDSIDPQSIKWLDDTVTIPK